MVLGGVLQFWVDLEESSSFGSFRMSANRAGQKLEESILLLFLEFGALRFSILIFEESSSVGPFWMQSSGFG